MFFETFIDSLELELPGIIREISKQYNTQGFIDNSDFLEKRLEKWHQFGILTHTKEVRKIFRNELNIILKKWGILEQVDKFLSEKIEGVEKRKLFELSILLHDLGKILVAQSGEVNREHEALSRVLLYRDFLKQKLSPLNLTGEQFYYLARCIETHDVIGKQIRDKLKHEDKLNLAYLSADKVMQMCRELMLRYPQIKIEIGIFFLCDSLGKTDVRISARTDKEITEQEREIVEILKQKNLNPELKYAVMQLPLNLKLTEIYLKTILNNSTT